MEVINFTFIIPHHNCPDLLNRCLDSIPQRDDIQIIVVDDASDEDKKPIIGRNGVEIYYIDREQAKGAGHARNVGMSKAKGKWLIFADSDDFYSPCIVELLNEYAYRDEPDIVYFNVDDTDSSCKNKTRIPFYFDRLRIGDVKYMKFIQFTYWVPWNKIYKHSFIKKNKIMWEEVRTGNDARFVLCCSIFAKTTEFRDVKAYNYMLNPTGITKRKKSFDEILDHAKRTCKLINFLRKINLSWYSFLKPIMGYHLFIRNVEQYGMSKALYYEFVVVYNLLRKKTYSEFTRNRLHV